MKEFTVYNRKSGQIDVSTVMVVDEEADMLFVGRSFRSPIDSPNRKLGRKIAKGRCLKILNRFSSRKDERNQTIAGVSTMAFKEQNYCGCHYEDFGDGDDIRLVSAFAVPISRLPEFRWLSCREHVVLEAYARKMVEKEAADMVEGTGTGVFSQFIAAIDKAREESFTKAQTAFHHLYYQEIH